MSLDYKPFQQSGPLTKLKEATFVPMNFCFIDELPLLLRLSYIANPCRPY